MINKINGLIENLNDSNIEETFAAYEVLKSEHSASFKLSFFKQTEASRAGYAICAKLEELKNVIQTALNNSYPEIDAEN
ncbi:MAG: hypothetical protein UX75_C0036G0013 [Candidatus Moranbacteria bacterium GW2011_GWE2_47_10]|nr:MAG: hypothetical protein UX75_C0036G0013 [Candidatus Moranbacteria bacterium GW2011_GWE2_47_10]